MEKVCKFIEENRTGFLASTDSEGHPHVRPFEFQYFEDGKYFFCTSNDKPVYQQLIENPFIEWAVMSQTMDRVRISGKIIFSNKQEEKERMIQNSPLVKFIYKTTDNPILQTFYMEHGSAALTIHKTHNTENFTF